jgi:hypothetical protein
MSNANPTIRGLGGGLEGSGCPMFDPPNHKLTHLHTNTVGWGGLAALTPPVHPPTNHLYYPGLTSQTLETRGTTPNGAGCQSLFYQMLGPDSINSHKKYVRVTSS